MYNTSEVNKVVHEYHVRIRSEPEEYVFYTKPKITNLMKTFKVTRAEIKMCELVCTYTMNLDVFVEHARKR
jgi:chromosome condensin MukBEF MukE localization factor